MSYPQPPGYQGSYEGPGAGGYPPPGYGPPGGGYGGYDPRAARLAELTQSAHNWLLLCALGWFLGFMWISGPLAWYQATQFRRVIEGFGAAVPSQVSNLRLFGIVTTVISVVLMLVGVVVVLAMAVGVAAWSAGAA